MFTDRSIFSAISSLITPLAKKTLPRAHARRVGMLAVAVLAAAMTMVVAVDPAYSSARQDVGHGITNGLVSDTSNALTRSPAAATVDTCAALRKNPHAHLERDKHGKLVASCVRTLQTTTTATPVAGAKANATAAAAGQFPTFSCDGQPADFWQVNARTSMCLEYTDLQYEVFQVDSDGNLIPVGFATLAYAIDVSTDVHSTSWTDTYGVKLLAIGGDVGPLTIDWTTTALCDAPCGMSASPWLTPQPLALGVAVTGTVTLSDNPARYIQDDISEEYHLVLWDNADLLPATTDYDTTALPYVRCDYDVGSDAGCVIPDFDPTLFLPREQYGAAADMIDWAQHTLSGHWGAVDEQAAGALPLHRQSDLAAGNRDNVCNDGSFVQDPNVDSDSCDEFPFASSAESPGVNSDFEGSSCAPVTADQTGTTGETAVDWATVTPADSVTGAEPCVRGHVPSSLNSAVGGALGAFTQNQRLLQGDAYWVQVTGQRPVFYSINVTGECQKVYGGDAHSEYQNWNDPDSWVCMDDAGNVLGIPSLQDWCDGAYPGTTAVTVNETAYGWRCKQ